MSSAINHLLPTISLVMATWFVIPPSSTSELALAVQVSQSRTTADKQIQEWVDQLSSPKFAQRELATNRLLAAGLQAIPVLEAAQKSDSVEVQTRVRRILAKLRAGGNTELSQSDSALLQQFVAAKPSRRMQLLRTYATTKQSLFFKLVEVELEEAAGNQQPRSSTVELLLDENPGVFFNMLSAAINRDDWEAIQFVINHPVTLQYSPMIRVHRARMQNNLPAYVDRTFVDLKSKHENQVPIARRDHISLIGVLRLQQDYDRLEQAINWLPDENMQASLRRKVMFQRGEWNQILQAMEAEKLAEIDLPTFQLQQAFLQYLTGDLDALNRTIADLRQSLADASVASKNQGDDANSAAAIEVQRLKNILQKVGIVTLNMELTEEFMDLDQTADTINFYQSLNRTEEALEAAQAGKNFDSRLSRMTDILEQLTTAQQELDQLEGGRREPEYQELNNKTSELTAIAFSVASVIENYGLDDEAQLYYQMIFNADRSSTGSNQRRALGRILDMGRQESYWHLAMQLLKSPERSRHEGRIDFGFNAYMASPLPRLWKSTVRGSFGDPVLEAKVLAAIVNSPWIEPSAIDFDLEYEIARYRSRAKLTTDGNTEYYLSQIMELHGKEDAAEEYLRQAESLGNSRALSSRVAYAVAAGDTKSILDYLSRNRSSYRFPSGGLVAEDAAMKLLDSGELSEQETAEMQHQLRQSRIFTMSIWYGGSQWISGGMRELEQYEATHLGIFPLQAIAYGVGGEPETPPQIRSALVSSLTSKQSRQRMLGAFGNVAMVYDSVGDESDNVSSIRDWARRSISLHYALAKGLIAEKKYDQATDLLMRVANYSLGDVSAGEDAIAELERVGENDNAQRLYDAIAGPYLDVLKEYPDSALARNNLAWLNARANRNLQAARRHAEVALKVRPHTVQYLDTMAEIEFLLGNHQRAYELGKRCVQLFPSRFYYRRQKQRFAAALIQPKSAN